MNKLGNINLAMFVCLSVVILLFNLNFLTLLKKVYVFKINLKAEQKIFEIIFWTKLALITIEDILFYNLSVILEYVNGNSLKYDLFNIRYSKMLNIDIS